MSRKSRRGRALVDGTSWSRRAFVLSLALSVVACDVLDRLVSVDAPSRVLADDLADPANAPLIVNSVVTDLECALAHYTVAGGLVANELKDASQRSGRLLELDRRTFTPGQYTAFPFAIRTCDDDEGVGVYQPLSTARWQGDNALQLLDSWTEAEVPARDSLTATAAAYTGYSLILLAEGMCSVALDGGPRLTPERVFQEAVDRFSTAITIAATGGLDEIENLARVGRARARRGAGDLLGAADDARAVPEGFLWNATYSSNARRRENVVFARNARDRAMSVETVFRDVTVDGMPDPRIAVEDTGEFGVDGVTELWVQTKYGSVSGSIPMATWEEAQLIIAEAELEEGSVQGAVEVLNGLRSRAGLPMLQAASVDEARDHLIRERAAELFLESHHLGDVRHFDLDLVPPPGSVDPFGVTYGSQRCFPLPDVETRNNENI